MHTPIVRVPQHGYLPDAMATKPFLIVSDIHLGAVPRATERAFREFLALVKETASGLLINGDLFDFWFEYRTVIPREHYRVLASLAEVVEGGVPISFIGGNHDAWGGAFLRDEVGIEVLNGPVKLNLAGRRALVAHGDGVGAGDHGYKLLRGILRNRLTSFAFRQLHPDWGNRIASVVSTTEGKTGKYMDEEEGRAAFVREWALEQLRSDPTLDFVTAGHVHAPSLVEVSPGRYYANSGDWINHHTYLSLPADGSPPQLKRWTLGA